ncbi:MAG: protein kinase [Myxococcales bacterium]|nr:protein kinase [Myxococcales bacterium]
MSAGFGAQGESTADGPPRTSSPGPARTLGKFTIVEQIGEGGMARIFLARSRGIGGFEKLVVLKQVLPRLAGDAEFVERFLQEARLSASLDHPNIAAVHEVGDDPAGTYFAMEYVRGRDLYKILRRAKAAGRVLGFDEIIAIVTALCAGLHHAHMHVGADGRPLGIVHRDVSPSNVLVSFEGAVKLADFGVAKVRSANVETEAGTLRGKIAYMSPEQCRGEALDRRSDVFAVGVLLWEMLTGARMRTGDSEIALMRQIADGDAPSPKALRPDLHGELEAIVMQALARDPARRWPSAEALQRALEDFAHDARLVVAPRTIAAMMQALFAEEIERESSEGELARTVALRREGDAEATPATATIPPVAVGTPEPPPRRRTWAPIVAAVIGGVALGGVALYLLAPRESATPVPPDPQPSVLAAPEPSPPRVEPAIAVVPIPIATTPEPPRAAAPSPRKAEVRRAPKRKRTPTPAPAPAPARPLDLDAPLPPGSGPR